MEHLCMLVALFLTLIGWGSGASQGKMGFHPPYRHIGCFEDKSRPQRAMPEPLGRWGGSAAIKQCAQAAWNSGYELFGVQNKRECWSSKNASLRYAMYGNSTRCSDGTGGKWANDVYAFLSCHDGYYGVNQENPCPPCPIDTYKRNNVSCSPCPALTRTWGRNAVNSSQYCTVKNPIKLPEQIHIKSVLQSEMIIANFTATYDNNSLVIPPLLYSIVSITKQYTFSKSEPDSRSTSTLDDFDSCQQLGNLSYPFCIFRNNGSIVMNRNFTCKDGDEFVIRINVTDSAEDRTGKIWNSNGSVIINCTDPCWSTRQAYDKARKLCSVPQPQTFNFTNNGSQMMQVNINISTYEMRSIRLFKEKGKVLQSCYLSILYKLPAKHTDVNISVSNFPINDTIKELRLSKPLRLEVPTFNLSLACNGNNSLLSYIDQVKFTVQLHESCIAINNTCLKALHEWKTLDNINCQQDSLNLMGYYGRCIAKPEIVLSAKIPLRVQSGTEVKVYCNVTSPIPVKIKWKKGYKNIANGSLLSLTADATDQGYYTCHVTSTLGSWRRRLLLVLKDYFTSYVHMNLNNEIADCKNKCKSIADKLLIANCTVGQYETCSCTLYGKKNNQTLEEYYDKLTSELNFTGVQKNSIVVRDAEYCLREQEGQVNLQGIFEWNSTHTESSSSIPCPYGPSGNKATRHCNGSFESGATWQSPNVVNCGFMSKNTELLDKLNKTKVTSNNAKQVAKNLSEIFNKSSSKGFTGADARLAADVLENIASITERLNETAGLVVDVIDVIMDINSTVLTNSGQAASKIIKVVDKIAENIPLEDGKSSIALTRENLVLQANKVEKDSFKGFKFGIKEDGTSVDLPTSVLKNTNNTTTRVGFAHYANNKLFQSKLEGNATRLSNIILSSSVYNTDTSNLAKPVKLTIPRLKGQDVESLRNYSCVYWDEKDRVWLRDGCSPCYQQESSRDTVQCCCNHLTNFAVLFSPQPVETLKEKTIHTKVLTIITYVGCGISFLGVIMTFLTYLLFRHLRKTNQQPILMNICVAIGLLLVVFVSGISTKDRLGCQIVAVLLHYLTLVTVLWMGIEAYNLYLQIVKVMAIYQRKFMLKAALVGWGVPLVIVLATLSAAIVQYRQSGGDIDFHYGKKEVCILHNNLYRLIAWFCPILVILVLNLVMFIVVVHKLQSTGAMVPVETKSTQRKRCWTALAIMFLLGLTWLFGALAISDARIVFEYLFCIFNSLQGFFIFFFHCVRIPEVRKQWSFFVSGLGFSHKGSEQSHPRSRGIGESQNHSQNAGKVRTKSWTPKDDEEVPRKGTVLTTVGDGNSQNGNTRTCKAVKEEEDVELDKMNSYNNYGCE